MDLKKLGMVAALLAAVCCGALLSGCADGSGEEDGNKWESPEDYEWKKVTGANKDSVVGEWRVDALPYEYLIEEFRIDDTFRCTYKFTARNEEKSYLEKHLEDIKESMSLTDKDNIKLSSDEENKMLQIIGSNLSYEGLFAVLKIQDLYINATNDRLCPGDPSSSGTRFFKDCVFAKVK